MMENVYHNGEKAIQKLLGESENEDGFIEILPDDLLRIPDYPGNNHYSTFSTRQFGSAINVMLN